MLMAATQRAALRASFESRFPGLFAYIKETEERHEPLTLEGLARFGGPSGPDWVEFNLYAAARTREQVERDAMNNADRALRTRRKKKGTIQ
jgi:hypothetical protein